jgi:multidrug efflux pump subunit AcrA (membrane-fusion protein)
MKQVTIALLLSATAAACGHDRQRPAEQAAPIAVTTATADVKGLPEEIEAGGTVRARTVAVLTSRIVGQVREILVQPGDRVRAGQVLAQLDGREMEANRERAEALVLAASQGQSAAESDKAAADAALTLARATFTRIATLREKKAATAQELDEAQAALSGAEARAQAAAAAVLAARANATGARAGLQGAQVASGYSRITAPFDGVVTQKQIDTGAMTMPGTPILTVQQNGGFEVEVRIDDSRAARIDWNATPVVRLNGDTTTGAETERPGKIVERALALDAAHTVLAKIAVPESADLRSGMFARVIFPGTARQVLTVPGDSIVQRGQLDAVFVAEEGRARYRVIEAGQRTSGLVEVRSGLVRGERVIRPVPAALVDGALITGVSR